MSVLKINMTYQCTAQCSHCRFSCTTDPYPVIDYDKAVDCIRTLKQKNNLELVVLLGGEPGLLPGLTHSLVEEVSRLGIASRVETNASWAVSEEAAEAFLGPLYSRGCSVMFSLDAFHAPFIPLERLEMAIRVSDKLGGSYNLEIPYLTYPDFTDELDQETNRLLAELEKRLDRTPCCPTYKGQVLFTGRAADKLAPRVSKGRGVPADLCREAPWWMNGDLDTLDLLILEPEGHIGKGCGIAIGNIAETPVEEILRTYDARKHPIFSTLMEQGPLGLAREAAEYGYVLKPDYADKCHLCREARQFLRAKYPKLLAPDRHYR